MKDKIIFNVKAYGREMSYVLSDRADIDDMEEVFKCIMGFLTFDPKNITELFEGEQQ